jgi:hypothetical protein
MGVGDLAERVAAANDIGSQEPPRATFREAENEADGQNAVGVESVQAGNGGDQPAERGP